MRVFNNIFEGSLNYVLWGLKFLFVGICVFIVFHDKWQKLNQQEFVLGIKEMHKTPCLWHTLKSTRNHQGT